MWEEGDAKQQLLFPTEEDGDWAAAGKQELSNLKRSKELCGSHCREWQNKYSGQRT